jgi:hypothetical protein
MRTRTKIVAAVAATVIAGFGGATVEALLLASPAHAETGNESQYLAALDRDGFGTQVYEPGTERGLLRIGHNAVSMFQGGATETQVVGMISTPDFPQWATKVIVHDAYIYLYQLPRQGDGV